jgi:coniferyl-aldehyde dehydrogenase
MLGATSEASAVFQRLQDRFDARGGLSLEERRQALKALRAGLQRRAEAFVAAVSADFGFRSRHETLLTEIVVVMQAIDYTLPRLAGWTKSRKIGLGPPYWPARARIEPIPRGVACVMGPSNYPLQLSLTPLIAALSAGCPTLLKPSEMTPRTADEIAALASEVFDAETVGVVRGGPEVGAALARLPFGVLLFTGSGKVGVEIAKAAAESLTPVVLELGGKSPALIDADADMARAARTIMAGKLMNAGQTCVAPDYLLTPRRRMSETVERLRTAALQLYPDAERRDYTAVASERAHARLARLESGLDVAPLFDAPPPRYRPALVIDPPQDHAIMRDEIFGPLLPVIPYDDIEEAIAVIRQHPAPLALYWLGEKNARFNEVVRRTRAGAVSLNETVLHAGISALPFGGVGASGYGRYHARAGFDAFSHERVVFEQTRWSLTHLLRPPYKATADRIIGRLVGGSKQK